MVEATDQTGAFTKSDFPILFLLTAIVTLNVFVFGQSIRHAFIVMDLHAYAGNPAIQEGLSVDSVRWAFTSIVASNWHPLTMIGHMTIVELFGPGPAGHHFAMVLLHTFNALLVFYLLRRTTGAVWRSGLVALAFSLHPLRVESVAWTAELKDVLSAFWILLMLWAYVRFAERRTVARYVPVVIAFALALMTKASVVTIPFALVLVDAWPLGRFALTWAGVRSKDFGRALLEKVPLLAMAVAMSLVTLTSFGESTLRNTEAFSLPYRAAMASVAYGMYLLQTVVPTNLAPHYPYTSPEIPYGAAGGSLLVILGVTAAAWRVRGSHPYCLIGWLWFLALLVPVSGILPIGSHFRADRYTYLPHVGLFLAVVWPAAGLAARSIVWRNAITGIGCLLVGALSFASFVQTMHWRDNYALFSHAVQIVPESGLVHSALATEYIRMEDAARGEEHLRRAIGINPLRLQDRKRLGALVLMQGRAEESRAICEHIVGLEPRNPENYVALAQALIALGEVDAARAALEEALRLDPDYARARRLLNAPP